MSNALYTPLGVPGSGRQRYAAAMTLHRAGQMSDAALEAYRIASPLDAQDPEELLRVVGAKRPALPDPTPATILQTLLDEVDRYLLTLPGPGIAEVRAGLNTVRFDPVTPAAGAQHPVVAAHLPTALTALQTTHATLAQTIAAAAPHLTWQAYDGYAPEEIGAAFAQGHAFASLIGLGAPFAAADFDLGLFVIAPNLLYRDHHHPAPELYAPLTGPHGWRFGPGQPIMVKPAHDPVWNPPNRPHLTKTGPVPFLCIYAWTADANGPAYLIPADDWAALESLQIEA
jgi:hypothetical protein